MKVRRLFLRFGRTLCLMALAQGSLAVYSQAGYGNLGEGVEVRASSYYANNSPSNVVDGLVSDGSRWLADPEDPDPWVELAFGEPITIGAVDIYAGYANDTILADFDLSFKRHDEWISPPAGQVRENSELAQRVEVSLSDVTKLRLTLLEPGWGRIREIAVYESLETEMKTGLEGTRLSLPPPPPPVHRDVHQVALNQVGFQLDGPKRFTAPLSADGTKFFVRPASGGKALFEGKIDGHVGDFSEFRPSDLSIQYIVTLHGGYLQEGISDPFEILENFWQDRFWQPAVNFLIDARSVVGTHPSAYGGSPWRDGTYYDAIIPALVLFYLADPERIQGMPKQIDWESDRTRVLSAEFDFDHRNRGSEGVMEAVHRYFTEIDPPAPDAPDVIKMIHWGVGFYLVNPATRDPSGDPDGRRIHSQTVEQVAYVVWAWPQLKQWLPHSFYERCLEFVFSNWEESLEVGEWWAPETYLAVEELEGDNPTGGFLHPYKGRHAPGHSIVPNILMYEIALREGREDPERYLTAAVRQADWIIENLDWKDPRTTKGHRMSEHRTIPNLVWLLQAYPEQAPEGLREKIYDWARVAIGRSNNLWDFRRFDEDSHWTIPKLNDVGNWVSFPAIALAASSIIEDPEMSDRLQTLAVSHADTVFGRNPRLAAAPSQPEHGFVGIDRGWPVSYREDVCARLELVRGSISSGPGSEMFPFNPEGNFRHAEGWVNYGASWCISLAYMELHRIGIVSGFGIR